MQFNVNLHGSDRSITLNSWKNWTILILFYLGFIMFFGRNMPGQFTLGKVAVNHLSPPPTSAPTNEKHHMLPKLIALNSEALKAQEATATANSEVGALFSSVFQATSSHAHSPATIRALWRSLTSTHTRPFDAKPHESNGQMFQNQTFAAQALPGPRQHADLAWGESRAETWRLEWRGWSSTHPRPVSLI